MKLRLPVQIGRYQIQSVLGQGSMGVVYLAHDPQLDRDVAIKTIQLPEGLSAGRRTRLTQSLIKEARLAARLSHPGIVAVFDAGEQAGEPYIVLERLEGSTLNDVLSRQGTLELELCLRIMEDLLGAIAYAHEQGIVHRDLKPANIMLQADGHVRIMDFGIAYAVTDQAADGEALAGTPRYMSPEQIECRPVDLRSDLFSLGTIFYEILSGRQPFMQRDFASLKDAITKASFAPLQTVAPNLPLALFALVERAMRRQPNERFRSAREMLEALKQCRQTTLPAALGAGGPSSHEIVDFIIERIGRQGDFPTTLQYISQITQVARKATSSASTIAENILKDFALTNRVLRMVNSAFYRTGGPPISTISRAVVVLGTDTIMDLATSLSLFEHFQHRSDVHDLKLLNIQSFLTALQSREIAREINYENTEEAFICGMLHHLGQLIVAFYFPDEYKAIGRLVGQGAMSEEQASQKIMRISYSKLGEAVSQSWRLPERVYHAIAGLAPDHRGSLRTPDLRLQGIVSFSSGLSRVATIADPARRQLALNNLTQQFSGLIDIRPRALQRIMNETLLGASDLSTSMKVSLSALGINVAEDAQVDQSGGAVAGVITSGARPDYISPLEEPTAGAIEPEELRQRQAFLMQTLGELAAALAGSYQINDILLMILEGMYRGIGFEHVLLALVTPKRDRVVCRFGLGPNIDEVRRAYQFALGPAGGLPARCILEMKEFYLASLDQGRWGDVLPAPLLDLLQAQSLALFPIVISGRAIGLFMATRSAEQPPIDKQDLLNLRTLTGQAVLALKQSTKSTNRS